MFSEIALFFYFEIGGVRFHPDVCIQLDGGWRGGVAEADRRWEKEAAGLAGGPEQLPGPLESLRRGRTRRSPPLSADQCRH